jgi:lipopolysaccharide transport system ATP-binding protein
MKDVSGAGRTVLFVSHNMASMKGLCSRGVLLERGTKIFEGNMSETVQKYLVGGRADGNLDYNLDNFRTVKSKALEISKIKLCNINAGTKSIYLNEPISIQIDIESKEIVPNVLMDCKIVSIEGIEIVHAMNTYQNAAQTIQIGLNSLEFKIENDLQPGNYYLTLGIHRPDGTTLEYLENCLSIEVLNVTSDNSKGHIYDYKLAYIRAKSEWKLK